MSRVGILGPPLRAVLASALLLFDLHLFPPHLRADRPLFLPRLLGDAHLLAHHRPLADDHFLLHHRNRHVLLGEPRLLARGAPPRRHPLDVHFLARHRNRHLLFLGAYALGDAHLAGLAAPLLHLELLLGNRDPHLLRRRCLASLLALLLALAEGALGTAAALQLRPGEAQDHFVAAHFLDVGRAAGVVRRKEEALLD